MHVSIMHMLITGSTGSGLFTGSRSAPSVSAADLSAAGHLASGSADAVVAGAGTASVVIVVQSFYRFSDVPLELPLETMSGV